MAFSWRRRGFLGLLGFLFFSGAAVAIASFAHRCLLAVLDFESGAFENFVACAGG